MKMLGIRRWMIVGVLGLLVLTGLLWHVTSALDQWLLQSLVQQQTQQDVALDAALREVVRSPARWHDPAWQRTLRGRLDTLGVGVVILDPSGAEILRTGQVRPSVHPNRQVLVAVVEGEQQAGTVELFVLERSGGLWPVPALLALVLAILFIGRQIGRYVVRPLEAMGVAARRIAGGNLDFELPESRVREVAEVRAAFLAMADGLRESIERQAELEEERRFFISAIAHDLRTPLFSLPGYLEGLDRGLATTPEKAAQYVGVCREKAEQLERLVTDLFAYTRAEYLEQTLRCERLALGPLLERVVEGLQPRAQARSVEIVRAGADDICIEADPHLLERAVENLLDNALRHTPPEGTVEVTWRAEPDRVVFRVADSGPGIAARDLPHLFDPLYRGDAARNLATGGAGLGLTIARRILRAHGGDLVAANRAGGGAEFTGWLCAASTAGAASRAHGARHSIP